MCWKPPGKEWLSASPVKRRGELEPRGVLRLRLRGCGREDTGIICGWQRAESGCKRSGGHDQNSKCSWRWRKCYEISKVKRSEGRLQRVVLIKGESTAQTENGEHLAKQQERLLWCLNTKQQWTNVVSPADGLAMGWSLGEGFWRPAASIRLE